MLKNYWRTALRNLWHTKVFSIINIVGLAIGLSAALVIGLVVHFDLSFENFRPGKDRIHRIVLDANFSGETFHMAGMPFAMTGAVASELTGVRDITPIYFTSLKVTIARPGDRDPALFKGPNRTVYTNAHYFSLFPSYTWLAGSAAPLDAPYHSVLTKSRAATYFPGLHPSEVIGKTITYNDSINAIVSGVISDPPANTDLNWNEFVSISTLAYTNTRYADPNEWGNFTDAAECFFELEPGVQPAAINSQLASLWKEHTGAPAAGISYTWRLQPLSDIHFNPFYTPFFHRTAHKPTLYGLILVAAFLLTLGCINFINLTTANAARRAREIGVRKTFGGSRTQLLLQFLGETFLLTLLSLFLSLALTPLLLRAFSGFIPPDLHFAPFHQPGLWLFLLTLLVIVTLLAGFYPSWILARFQPMQVLRNQPVAGAASRRAALRKFLTIFQFTMAQAFIIATVIVGRQLHYSLTSDLGFKKDAIAGFDVPFATDPADNKRFLLLERIRNLPGIQLAGLGSIAPASEFPNTSEFTYANGKQKLDLQLQLREGDSNYIKIYHLPLLAGRNLRPSDSSTELIINRTLCTLLGFKDPVDAIGKTLLNGSSQRVPIVGVIADFHQAGMHTPIKPLVLTWSNKDHFTMHLALSPQTPDGASWKTTMAQVEKAYKETYPRRDFDFEFLDDSIAKYYVAEQQLSTLLRWATGLTIFISCLGLAGLVIFTTNTRTKEIGIRKVLGAPVAAIIALLSKEFVKLLAIAFAIAAPVAWWATHQWLDSFAYRAPVSWWIFPLAGLTMMGIALLTMSVRTIRAATANPVDALRSE
jgi:putative ABC transport system permease protein